MQIHLYNLEKYLEINTIEKITKYFPVATKSKSLDTFPIEILLGC